MKRKPLTIEYIQTANKTVINPYEIATTYAQYFASISSTKNYDPTFQQHKVEIEEKKTQFPNYKQCQL